MYDFSFVKGVLRGALVIQNSHVICKISRVQRSNLPKKFSGCIEMAAPESSNDGVVSDTTAMLTLAVALQRRCDGQIAHRREGCCILGRRCSFQFLVTDLHHPLKGSK